MACNGLAPALLGMIADGTHPSERLGAYVLCMLVAAPSFLVAYISLTAFVLAEHLHSYTHVWAGITAVSAVGLLAALSCPETLRLPPPPTAPSADVEPKGGVTTTDDQRAAEEDAHDSSTGKQRRRKPPRLCACVAAGVWCCGGLGRRDGGAGSNDGDGGERGSATPAANTPHLLRRTACASLLAPFANRALRFLVLLEVPVVFALGALSTLDGFALTAYQWEQETIYYVRLVALGACVAAVAASLPLLRLFGPLITLQMGLLALLLSLLLLCLAQWHVALLYAALGLAGTSALGVLPALRLLATQLPAGQQAAASASVLAVAHGSKALALAAHAYLFEEASARGILYGPPLLGALAAAVALVISAACAPTDGSRGRRGRRVDVRRRGTGAAAAALGAAP